MKLDPEIEQLGHDSVKIAYLYLIFFIYSTGFSVKETRGLYFGLKNSVFFGNRPYPSEPLETFLKQLFGEDTKMDTIVKHK